LYPTETISKFIPTGDALIHCEIFNREEAATLVFLHGNNENLHIFDPQIRYFSAYYGTVAIDTRAHGLSTRGSAPFNFYTFADDLISVLNALHIEKAHIVGFSDGAIIALHLALTAPERIESMVLLGANYHPKGLRWIIRLQLWLVFIGLSLASLFSAKMRQRKEIWSLMIHQPNLTIAELSQIAAPTLVVSGENDMVSQSHNDEISRAIAGSKRLIIPKEDHFWMFTKPEALNQCVMEFLSSLK